MQRIINFFKDIIPSRSNSVLFWNAIVYIGYFAAVFFSVDSVETAQVISIILTMILCVMAFSSIVDDDVAYENHLWMLLSFGFWVFLLVVLAVLCCVMVCTMVKDFNNWLNNMRN